MARQPTQTALTPAAMIAAHMAELRQTDKALLAELLSYEARATILEPPPAGPSRGTRSRWMNGFSSAAAVGPRGGARMHQIIVDRADIKAALSRLEIQRIEAQNIEDAAAAAAATPRFLALIKADVLWAEEGKARHAAIAEMLAGPGAQMLPFAHLFSRPIIGTAWVKRSGQPCA